MATVYLARRGGIAGFQRLVAIKRLHPYLQREQQFVQMFLDEARLAAGIHHPHVVSILEVGASEAGYYLVMEYVEGDTLARLLARAISGTDETFPIPVAVRVMLDTLEGLHAAHELTDDFGKRLELVHRDVSPQNILVGVDGVTRLTDFGVARALSRLNATRAGQMKGKLAYMAPEQAKTEDVDRRTDVFAAGIVLWESLCLRRLFKGESDGETLNRILFEPVPRARDTNPAIPAELDAVVAKALARKPEDRFQDCAEFGDALEHAAAACSCLAPVREVSAFVQSTLGNEIAAQRDKVRAWLSRSEPSQAWPTPPSDGVSSSPSVSSVSSAAMALSSVGRELPASQPRATQSVVGRRNGAPAWAWAALGAAGVLLLGSAAVGVFLARARPPGGVTVSAAATPDSHPADPPSAAEAPASSASASSTAFGVPSAPAVVTEEPAASPPPKSGEAPGKRRPRGDPVKPATGKETDDLTTNPYR
jgi:serine/threonine-protein kinase